MVIRTFLDKATTIVSDRTENYGLHPICILSYGPTVSRFLIHFNIDKIQKNFDGLANVKHFLKMQNCASLESSSFKDMIDSPDANGYRKRASSFRIMALRLPDSEKYSWDEGIGFDNSQDFWLTGDSVVSNNGANWFQSYNGMLWDENGVYSNETIRKEIEKFNSGDTDTFIISRQKFDHGNENISLDITSYVNDIIEGRHNNNGILICFYPDLEEKNEKISQYVGFFSNTTRTFFEPIIESRFEESINDDRNNFIIGKKNRLYCYIRNNGELVDSKLLPVCKIDGTEYQVIRQRKGVYYASVCLNEAPNTIKYDEWSNILIDEETSAETVEMEFVTKPHSMQYSIGNSFEPKSSFSCSCNGINKYEKINQGDNRVISVDFKIPYANQKAKNVRDVSYRLYVMDGKNEVDVIEYDKADMTANGAAFLIKADELVPSEYFVDIKASANDEIRIFKKELVFTVVDNSTERNL